MLKIFPKYLNFENISKKCIRVPGPLEWVEGLNSQKVCHILISPLNLNSSSFGSLITTLFDVLFEEWIDKDENSLSGCFGEYKHESIFTRIWWNLLLLSKIWSSLWSNSSVSKLYKSFGSSSLTLSILFCQTVFLSL